MFKIGISSATLPKNTSKELRDFLKLSDLDQVDLRINKGQKWEEDGLGIFEKEEIAFIGTDIILGDTYWDVEEINTYLKDYNGFHIRVFAKNGFLGKNEFLLKQINSLISICGDSHKILVETHEGYSSPIEIYELASNFKLKVLLDNFGLAKISNNPKRDLKLLQPFISHVHIKGFNEDDPINSIHLSIRQSNLLDIEFLLNLFVDKDVSILLETKNDAFQSDLKFLVSYRNKKMRC